MIYRNNNKSWLENGKKSCVLLAFVAVLTVAFLVAFSQPLQAAQNSFGGNRFDTAFFGEESDFFGRTSGWITSRTLETEPAEPNNLTEPAELDELNEPAEQYEPAEFDELVEQNSYNGLDDSDNPDNLTEPNETDGLNGSDESDGLDESNETDETDGLNQPTEEEPAAAWSNNMLAYEELDTRREGVELIGRIPFITEDAGNLAERINEQINAIISAKITEARETRARLLSFDYELFFAHPYVSITLKSTITTASSKTDITSINFDVTTGEVLTAADIVGVHVMQLADRLLLERIRRNPASYNPNFDGMPKNQAFSITNTELIFWMNDFQFATGNDSPFTLTLRLNNIKEYVLYRHLYHIRADGFNLKMVPLRTVGHLGYEYTWHAETNSTSVFYNGALIIEVVPGVNNYVREERFSRSLEVAPEVLFTNGYTTYVPLSFFDQILSLVAFTIDADDNIIFVSYPVTDAWFER
ncbi:MAG: hypothetical protein FWG68_04440 [Defluviitaleaceae bacterium]|nr:hypothetical protein [Defluviitaleaceae bacterium]